MNSCYIFISSIDAKEVILTNYSHIIPIVISLLLSIFVYIKSNKGLLSKAFFYFTITFSLWLIGDLIAWTSYNYNLIYSAWSPLDFIEIVSYIFGLYFIWIFINKKDLSINKKILLFVVALPAFVITITKYSVLGFDQANCEAIGNNNLSIYKIIAESILLLTMLGIVIKSIIDKSTRQITLKNIIVGGSMFLFLLVFGVSEYIGSTTGFYELNLYSLFLLPIFLLIIIYSIFELDIFNFRILGTHYLVIGLVILMISQLFFINGSTDQLLTILTIALALGLSVILFRNLKKESDQRVRIEKLSGELEQSKMRLEKTNIDLEVANDKLKGLDKLKTEFLSLASHQLRSPLTAIKGYASMLKEGDFGDLNDEAKETISRILSSSQNLTKVVEDLLNVTKIEQGGMQYEMVDFNISDLIKEVTNEQSITAEHKGLKLIYDYQSDIEYKIKGDKDKLRQVVMNLIDNSIKYTRTGEIKIILSKDNSKVRITIKDTGIGMTEKIIESLFEKFARSEDGMQENASGSGLGLYLAKQIVLAHKGSIWAESEGKDKGSTFIIELEESK
jgi:signal transduction histidine kinase